MGRLLWEREQRGGKKNQLMSTFLQLGCSADVVPGCLLDNLSSLSQVNVTCFIGVKTQDSDRKKISLVTRCASQSPGHFYFFLLGLFSGVSFLVFRWRNQGSKKRGMCTGEWGPSRDLKGGHAFYPPTHLSSHPTFCLQA